MSLHIFVRAKIRELLENGREWLDFVNKVSLDISTPFNFIGRAFIYTFARFRPIAPNSRRVSAEGDSQLAYRNI